MTAGSAESASAAPRTARSKYFIPDPDNVEKGTSAAEGVTADDAGNIYGAEVGPKRLMRYSKK